MPKGAALLGIAFLVAACGAAAAPAPAATGTEARTAVSVAASAAASPKATGTLGERSTEGGGVEVKASWVSSDPPALMVTMDTHSVDLDVFDLATMAKLRIDGGSWVAPSAVEMPKGGHHREGRLQFSSVASAFGAAGVIELEITGVAVPTRSFRWERGG
ncbi:MAG: hypothetical protein HYU87_01200 [Chloroflexi bacterium]|nr:hypothetical protein [Chloroflexota bacterium]